MVIYNHRGTTPDIDEEETDMKNFPKYVKTADGYIGVFRYLDFGEFPVYRFPGGERIADNWEIENGSDNREDLS